MATIRLNYADQNGYPYWSIGRVLVDRGELKLEDASMQDPGVGAANPGRRDELLNSNLSYVFFAKRRTAMAARSALPAFR